MRLDRADLTPEPLALFDRWYADAATLGEPEAMTLATLGDDGAPDARTVLMRGIDRRPGHEGLIFYTNYLSAKGRGLAAHPDCALLFYWGDLLGKSPFGGRQVRIRGRAEMVEPHLSDAYFATRPLLSQVGAWASLQSEVIADGWLEEEVARGLDFYDEAIVPRPPYWGGYRVVIRTIEFWQGQSGRLHDRFRYSRDGAGWRVDRLAP